MRHVLLAVLVLAAPGAAQEAGPNSLTARDLADGWILLFDGESTYGWTTSLIQPARVDKGALRLEAAAPNGCLARHGSAFPAFELALEYQSKGNAQLMLTSDKGVTDYAFFHALPAADAWKAMTVEVRPGVLHIDGKKQERLPPGRSRLAFIVEDDGLLRARNIKVRPLNAQPLFNGKDLAGWTVFPKKKSTFAVVDGAINVKDGPGDLQTTGKYQDFILQLECKSHGKHLNSGIFFRCRDGEYQNGYEAQIRNEFKPEPTQKYLIEEYDPKTHKLIGKKEQLFSAVDFGTGAIYRRQPARKEMSKDGEWFGMTIVAQGNHFATWVNGVQVTDWTDHRPRSDNARTGCRLEGGHISIQGHDPTTNLSFRNLRIAEFPGPK